MKLLKFPCLVFLLQFSFRECERYPLNIQYQFINICFNNGDEEFVWFCRYPANWTNSRERLSFNKVSLKLENNELLEDF